MSKPIKDQIADNLEQAKGEGKLRSENIRGLLSDAASLTVSELREGTEQMRAILKEAISAVITEIKDTGSEIPEKITSSIESAIEESTRYRQEAIVSLQAKMHEIQAQVEEKQRQLDADFDDTIIDIKATEISDSENLTPAFGLAVSERIDDAINNVRERKESEALKQQYLNLEFELARLDAKLMDRYGDKYAEVKQQLDKIKTLYEQTKSEAESSGVTPVQSKQTEIERKLSKFASVVAITEREIVQYLQELWKNKGFDPHHKN
jgi:hypothetical protein